MTNKYGNRPTEESIQSAIVDYLRLSGWKVMVYAPPRAHKKLGGILEPGHPDLLAIREYRPDGVNQDQPWHLWIEVKRPSEKPTPDQEKLHAELRVLGAWVEVWSSVDQAIAVLAPMGLGLAEWTP